MIGDDAKDTVDIKRLQWFMCADKTFHLGVDYTWTLSLHTPAASQPTASTAGAGMMSLASQTSVANGRRRAIKWALVDSFDTVATLMIPSSNTSEMKSRSQLVALRNMFSDRNETDLEL